MSEGYSHELASCGFWPAAAEEGAFYAYAYPEPPGYPEQPIRPDAAHHSASGEYLLPYEAVATASNPDRALTQFLQTTYAAAADLAGWDRAALQNDRHRTL